MPRTTTPAYDAAIAKVVTAPGHLLEIATPTPIRLSDTGSFMQSTGQIFAAAGLWFSGLAFNAEAPRGGVRVQIQNLDNAVGSLLLNLNLAEVPVRIWLMEAGLNQPGDTPYLGDWAITNSEIGLDYVTLNLLPPLYYAPQRRVSRAYGFKFAVPEGTVVHWGNDTVTIKSERN